eukprot:475088-Rhodomonas_salina.1
MAANEGITRVLHGRPSVCRSDIDELQQAQRRSQTHTGSVLVGWVRRPVREADAVSDLMQQHRVQVHGLWVLPTPPKPSAPPPKLAAPPPNMTALPPTVSTAATTCVRTATK